MIYSRIIFFFISLLAATLLLLDTPAANAFVPGGGRQPSAATSSIVSSPPLLPFWGHPPLLRHYFVHEEPRTQFILRASEQNSKNSNDDNDEIPPGPVKLIIAGAPASGKGTQCEVIKEKYGVVHLSTGDMLRAAVLAGSDVGKQAKAYMDSGKLVPDEVIIGVVKDRLDQGDCRERGWLLDGFPRTLAQAKALEDAGISADCFIFLNVPDNILVERVVGRRTDPVTGKIYHMKFSPPRDEEIMARLQQRSDDTEEKVKVRLQQFHANVDSVKDSYTNISVIVDGNRAPSEVSKEITKAVAQQMSAVA